MIQRSTACLINDYDSIAELCRSGNEPVFITDDGETGIVTMSIETYKYREGMAALRATLMEREAYRLAGGKTYSLEEAVKRMEDIINEAEQ